MKNIDKQIIYQIYKQHREKVNDIINDEGYNIYANIGNKLWDVAWLQVENNVTNNVVMQVKNKLKHEEY
jgi:Gpi18-like mannosyltransferase